MKDRKKILQQIRKAEQELVYANPKQAAQLAEKIVRLKDVIFKK